MINFIRSYLGWRDWAVLSYNSAVDIAFPVLFIALHDQLYTWEFVADFFILFLFSVFSTTYGYLVNDLADRDLDRAHGKSNTFEKDSTLKATLIVLFFLSLGVIFAIRFIGRPGFLPLWLVWLFIATFYSVKPIRLKEKGKVGLAFVVLAQRVLPVLIAFAAFQYRDVFTVIIFTIYILFRGLSSDVNHQLEDLSRDTITRTGTFAVQAGTLKVERLLRFSLEAEKLLLLGCLFFIYFKLPALTMYGVSLVMPILGVYVVLYGTSILMLGKDSAMKTVNPFTCGRNSIYHSVHRTFPSVVLPVYLSVLLASQQWMFLAILAFFVIYHRLYSLELILNTFPFSVLKR
jgi:4-hydroxybenzoate polyprenyltransferase